FLARHDTDLYSRWEALNTLFVEALINASAHMRGGKTPAFHPALLECAVEVAQGDSLEPAYRAPAPTLPAEADTPRALRRNVDPDAILAARAALRKSIGRQAQADFKKIYDAQADDRPFSPDAASAGKRSLRNVLLDYLVAAAGEPELAASQFETADNMTD